MGQGIDPRATRLKGKPPGESRLALASGPWLTVGNNKNDIGKQQDGRHCT
jgi:hypothetical protein